MQWLCFPKKDGRMGYHCDVIAPSLIPKKAGNRGKNDFRDARDLAQNYAAGMLSIVHPPAKKRRLCATWFAAVHHSEMMRRGSNTKSTPSFSLKGFSGRRASGPLPTENG